MRIGEFLPRYGEDSIVYGTTKVFFKDYAFTTFTKKYSQYLYNLNMKTVLIQRNITAFVLAKKGQRLKTGS